MISFLIAFTSVALIAKQAWGVQTHNYCAEISSSTSSGNSGYYALRIAGGQALHSYHLDMSAGSTDTASCTDSSGAKSLTYSLQSLWNLADTSSSVSCSATTTVITNNVYTYVPVIGGRYDPYLACSSLSQYYNAQQQGGGGGQQQQMNYCNTLRRMPAQQNQNNNNNNANAQFSYTYFCNSTGFQVQEQFNTCEVGDFSGKLGAAVSSNGVFTPGSILVDPLPPLSGNFKQPMELSQPWSSIAFRCNSLPIACATFVKVSDVTTSACAPAFEAMTFYTNPTSAPAALSSSSVAADGGYTSEEYNGAIIASVLLCLFGGLVVGGLAVYFYFKKSSGGDGPLLGGAKSGDYSLYK